MILPIDYNFVKARHGLYRIVDANDPDRNICLVTETLKNNPNAKINVGSGFNVSCENQELILDCPREDCEYEMTLVKGCSLSFSVGYNKEEGKTLLINSESGGVIGGGILSVNDGTGYKNNAILKVQSFNFIHSDYVNLEIDSNSSHGNLAFDRVKILNLRLEGNTENKDLDFIIIDQKLGRNNIKTKISLSSKERQELRLERLNLIGENNGHTLFEVSNRKGDARIIGASIKVDTNDTRLIADSIDISGKFMGNDTNLILKNYVDVNGDLVIKDIDECVLEQVDSDSNLSIAGLDINRTSKVEASIATFDSRSGTIIGNEAKIKNSRIVSNVESPVTFDKIFLSDSTLEINNDNMGAKEYKVENLRLSSRSSVKAELSELEKFDSLSVEGKIDIKNPKALVEDANVDIEARNKTAMPYERISIENCAFGKEGKILFSRKSPRSKIVDTVISGSLSVSANGDESFVTITDCEFSGTNRVCGLGIINSCLGVDGDVWLEGELDSLYIEGENVFSDVAPIAPKMIKVKEEKLSTKIDIEL